MSERTLRTIARRYVATIEAIERTNITAKLLALEERRVILHNQLIDHLKREGVPCYDRDHVTKMAYQIARRQD